MAEAPAEGGGMSVEKWVLAVVLGVVVCMELVLMAEMNAHGAGWQAAIMAFMAGGTLVSGIFIAKTP
jgi:hypothetical protein